MAHNPSDPAAAPAQDRLFVTDRLSIRRWRDTDTAGILALYGIRDVIRWVDDGEPLSAAEAERWMTVTQRNYETYGYGMFAIDDRAQSRNVGFGGLVHPGGQTRAEVKYALWPEFWGQGFATEFVRGLLDYTSRNHAIADIMATVAPDNIASQNVLGKSGFRNVGLRQNDDGSQTAVFEWEGNRQAKRGSYP
ncbi:GNAT family N-acetyltransferase [Roseobacter sp. HKCCA0434]|uniref:GNAT family N-acetyltransferase n=1 Tax=Roseobacter sp. HKCCA0434 TaxID=3079297 RepID=UPI002905B153|nr:GNAT family N-acetyltransferase [Roseobacter sp. HKCCA0434]